jgi:hypothetical protein
MKKLLGALGILIAALTLSALAQGPGRLSPDDQREFAKYYTKWVNDTRRNERSVAGHYRGTPPESAAGVPEHELDPGVRKEGDRLAGPPGDTKDFEEAAMRACELVLAGDPRIGKVPGARRTSRSGAKQAARSPKRAKAPKTARNARAKS